MLKDYKTYIKEAIKNYEEEPEEEDDDLDISLTPDKDGIGMLIGKTLTRIDVNKPYTIKFYTDDGDGYLMYHEQDCCEGVTIDDIIGDLDDLIGRPILMAREDTSRENPKPDTDDSFTWTFYNLATIKGYVSIRWYGCSNGYYSERVDFVKMAKTAKYFNDKEVGEWIEKFKNKK